MDLEQYFHFFLKKYGYLTREDIDDFIKISTLKHYKKGEYFLRENAYSLRIGIIIKGLIRGYMLSYEGKEITTMFREEYDVVGAYETIFKNQVSHSNFVALEDTILFVGNYEKIIKFKNPRIQQGVNAIIQENLYLTMQRLENIILYSPLERYMGLINTKPELIQRVPQKYVASHLGVTPQSFSRMKKRMKKLNLSKRDGTL